MHSTRNQNPALAPFLRVAFEASALACPCSGGLACLRRSNVARQERPAVPRIVVPFFYQMGRPSQFSCPRWTLRCENFVFVGVLLRAALRFAAPFQINRSFQGSIDPPLFGYRTSLFVRNEYFSSIFFHGHRKEDLIFIR